MAQDTVFDMILAKKIPADVVHEDEHVLAFRDIMPQAPVHVIVIPKKKVGRYAELSASATSDVGEFFKRVAGVAKKLNLEGKGYRVVVNNGDDGGQTVEYLHAHILGGRALAWPPG